MENRFHSKLYVAKGRGSSGEGGHHWWMQRLTSVFMIPLAGWLLLQIKFSDAETFVHIFHKPVNAIAAMLFVFVMFYHAMLGMKVVIEDYVANLSYRFALIMLMEFVTLVTVVGVVAALLYNLLV